MLTMGVEKIYKGDVKDTTQPIKGELHLEGEDFEYEYFLLPIIGQNKSETEKMLISRLGNRMQNEKKCLDIDEELVTTNIENDEYSSIVFIKNKQDDDVASGTMQYYDWCENGKSKGKPQIWVNDLCRIATKKRPISPVKALLVVFELIAAKYVKGMRYIHLMVDKEKPEQAEVLTNIYGKYGYVIVEKKDCELEGEDEYILMKKKIDRKGVKTSVKRQSIRTSANKSKAKTIKIFSEGFTGTKGAVKPRSSLDVVHADDLRSVKSTDDEKKSKPKTPSPITPSRIFNARGNVTLPLESPTFVGDLNRQRCKESIPKPKTPSPIEEPTPKLKTPSPIKEPTPKLKTPSPIK